MGGRMTKIRLAYVHEFRDRHGRLRHYVRLKGSPQVPLPGIPGSKEFMAAYDLAVTGKVTPKQPKDGPGTMGALICSFRRSVEFANLAPSSKTTYGKILRVLEDRHAHRNVRDLTGDKARKLIEQIGATRPGMANLTASIFRRLMTHAVDIGLRTDNPLARMPRYKMDSVHTWSEEELAAYESRWPL